MRTETLLGKVRKMEVAKGCGFDFIEALDVGRRMAAGASREEILQSFEEDLPAGMEWDCIREARRRVLKGDVRHEDRRVDCQS